MKEFWQWYAGRVQLLLEFFLQIWQRLAIRRNLFLHEPDDVANIGIDRHGHVVGQIIGNAFICESQTFNKHKSNLKVD